MQLNYEPLEKIKVKRPIHRIPYVIKNVQNKYVLDIGCYDETALIKRGTKYCLYEEISKVAAYVLGIDNSSKIPEEGIIINEKSKIIKGDACNIDKKFLDKYNFNVVVAGELIEHLPNVLDFFIFLKNNFQGKQLICSTPNAISLSNVLAGTLKREATHPDHLQAYSYKILNTLCLKAAFLEWEIIPHHVCFTEIIFKSKGIKKIFVQVMEKIINYLEDIFPLLSGGLILNVKRI